MKKQSFCLTYDFLLLGKQDDFNTSWQTAMQLSLSYYRKPPVYACMGMWPVSAVEGNQRETTSGKTGLEQRRNVNVMTTTNMSDNC